MNPEERRKERLDRPIKARSEGLYAISSWREIAYLSAPRAGLFLVLLIIPLVMPSVFLYNPAHEQGSKEKQPLCAAS